MFSFLGKSQIYQFLLLKFIIISLSKCIMSEESFLFQEKSTNRGFEIIFEVIPAFSLYQFLCLLTTVWLKIPSGAIQLAAVVLQGRVVFPIKTQIFNNLIR